MVFAANSVFLSRIIFWAMHVPEFCTMKKAKPRLNKEWHLAHPMPKNPTLQQRIDWHSEHAKHCGCREISGTIKKEMKKLGIGIPH